MPDENKQSVAPPVSAVGRYEALRTERDPFERRGRDASLYTIPSILPPEGSSGSTTLYTPYQSVGAEGVNNLAAKLLLALFPPGTAFFKLNVSQKILDELKAESQGQADAEGEFEKALSKLERTIMEKLESINTRPILHECARHLVTVGNGLIKVDAKGFKFWPLSRYVVKRDLEGNELEIVIKESLSRLSLPQAAKAIVEKHSQDNDYNDPNKPLDLFTRVWLTESGRWSVVQEICGEVIPESAGSYNKDESPFVPVCWNRASGEDYGRGHVEEYMGDLGSLESLSQSLVDGAAAMAKILFLVDEAGVTQKKTIAEAPNLAVRDGNAKDVTVLQVEKAIDLQVAESRADKIERRVEKAFLLASSATRDAERVTAEEVRLLAAELETTLGGIYSRLSQELQLPIVVRLMVQMAKSDELPHLPKKAVVPTIITGLAGLGRTTELQKLDTLLAGVAQIFGPEAIATYTNAGKYIQRRAAALGVDIEGLIRSDEEVQAAQQQATQQQLAEKLGPTAIKANADRDLAAQQQAAEQAAPPQ